MSKQSLSYKDAGVDINAGNALVEQIKTDVKRTARAEVIGGLVALVPYARYRPNIKSRFWFPVRMVSAQNYVLPLI